MLSLAYIGRHVSAKLPQRLHVGVGRTAMRPKTSVARERAAINTEKGCYARDHRAVLVAVRRAAGRAERQDRGVYEPQYPGSTVGELPVYRDNPLLRVRSSILFKKL